MNQSNFFIRQHFRKYFPQKHSQFLVATAIGNVASIPWANQREKVTLNSLQNTGQADETDRELKIS